jgi:hypothetical protein
MKKSVTTISLLLLILFVVASCGSPYKKRKRCRGNGSWYGNRNLGAVDQQKAKTPTVYRLEDAAMTASID